MVPKTLKKEQMLQASVNCIIGFLTSLANDYNKRRKILQQSAGISAELFLESGFTLD